MKGLFKTALCAAVALAFTFGTAAFAAPARADDGGFTIPEYDVKIVISDSGVYDVTETITVNFKEPRHGIYRDIPLSGTMTWRDCRGAPMSTDYVAQVADIDVAGHLFSVNQSGGNEEIRIGDADKTVQGMQTYVISYKLRFHGEGSKELDQVYYNIIGDGWNTTIDHAEFSVTLPAAFDGSLPGFSMGAQGTSGYKPDELSVTVAGATITGETKRVLQPYEGLTMSLVLPEGYFAQSTVSPAPSATPDKGGLSITTGGKGSLTITPEANPDAGQDQAKNLRALAFLLIAVLVALASPGR